jgi:nucleoside-diphosphate-sugar epimerase
VSNPSSKIVAVLGATGHIARSLMEGFSRAGGYEFLLYARSPDRVKAFLDRIGWAGSAACDTFDRFGSAGFDAVINCVGAGDPARVKAAGASILELTETYDDMVLGYLDAHPETRYIHFSSGAAYVTDFASPAGEGTPVARGGGLGDPADYYGSAKREAEAKHRARADLRIVDLRVFGFFSRHIDPGAKFFLCEVLSCVKEGRPLVTGPEDIVRDYVHPLDLQALVSLCLEGEAANDAFDACSAAPARKFEILDHFASRYGLKVQVKEGAGAASPTGSKPMYYSTSRRAGRIGYSPKFTSMETVIGESEAILGSGRP